MILPALMAGKNFLILFVFSINIKTITLYNIFLFKTKHPRPRFREDDRGVLNILLFTFLFLYFFGDITWHRLVVMKLHTIASTSLSHTTQRCSIAKHF